MQKEIVRDILPEEIEAMLPRLRMTTPVRLIYRQANGEVYGYPTRVGRILLRAQVEIDDWFGSLEMALWEAVEKLGARAKAECFVKRLS